MKTLLFGTLIAVGLGLTPAAHAERPVSRFATAVHYGDIDITTEAGAEVLVARIHKAAVDGCRSIYSARTLDHTRRELSCVRGSMRKAVLTVDMPRVTERSNRPL